MRPTITTVFTAPRGVTEYLIQESLGKLLLEDWTGALILESSTFINTVLTPRTKPTTAWS